MHDKFVLLGPFVFFAIQWELFQARDRGQAQQGYATLRSCTWAHDCILQIRSCRDTPVDTIVDGMVCGRERWKPTAVCAFCPVAEGGPFVRARRATGLVEG